MIPLPNVLLAELSVNNDFDIEAFIEAHRVETPISVRLNPLKPSNRFIEAEKVIWCAHGRYLNARPIFTLDPLFHAGAYYVQEASSMLLQYFVDKLFDRHTPLRALDLCAAPGGKSTLLACALPQGSLLISNEVIRSRAGILEENITRWGYSNTWVCSNDAKEIGGLYGYFDVIVVDAPCSGSGLFRKDKAAITEWSEGNVELCCQRQQRILADVWPALKEDGILIYSTCSYSQKEDEAILDWLITEMGAESINMNLPVEWGFVLTESKCGAYGYKAFPHLVKGEGFFIAALRKKQISKILKPVREKFVEDKIIRSHTESLLSMDNYVCVPKYKESYAAIEKGHISDYILLKEKLYFHKIGIALGALMHNDWVPHHELALSIDVLETVPRVEVELDNALRFLKKEDMKLVLPDKGWYIVSYQNLGLGWIKNLGNRCNNYLPAPYRIRMDIKETEW